jgi:hypothetical protein
VGCLQVASKNTGAQWIGELLPAADFDTDGALTCAVIRITDERCVAVSQSLVQSLPLVFTSPEGNQWGSVVVMDVLSRAVNGLSGLGVG